jgi:trk system potassium uptake protein TrkH
MVSSSGAIRADYTEWPALAQGALIVLMIVGGCSGSTAGGIKVIRFTVLWKQIANEIRRTLSPQGVFSVRLNKKVGRRDVMSGTAGFVVLYLMLVMVTTLATAAAGVDLFSAFSQAISVIGNVGAGFGSIGVSPDYSLFPAWLKWVYCVAMIAGRLELWTVFIVFTPAYWR